MCNKIILQRNNFISKAQSKVKDNGGIGPKMLKITPKMEDSKKCYEHKIKVISELMFNKSVHTDTNKM